MIITLCMCLHSWPCEMSFLGLATGCQHATFISGLNVNRVHCAGRRPTHVLLHLWFCLRVKDMLIVPADLASAWGNRLRRGPPPRGLAMMPHVCC